LSLREAATWFAGSRTAANAFVVRDLPGAADKPLERAGRWLFSALWFEGYTL
jgi:hypothetical protein